MVDRTELLEAALESHPEGIALLDINDKIAFWNRTAELMTGYCAADLVGREIPRALEPLMTGRDYEMQDTPSNGPRPGRGSLVHAQHKHGQDVPALARTVVLRDGLGRRIGIAAVFHLAENISALPHGQTSEGSDVQHSQLEFQDRLESEYGAFVQEGAPLGMLWFTVDQASELRKTHGAGACETMLENMERTLANALRPGEEVGRWGNDEFLVLSHEKDGAVLGNHGRVLAGLARTADFKWWGDRVSLTVSGGVAVAETNETLQGVLERASAAMVRSIQAGGNQCTFAPGGHVCLP